MTPSQRQAVLMRYWECGCCGLLIVTLQQDDANRYKCCQCEFVGCKEGSFIEIEPQKFIKEAEL